MKSRVPKAFEWNVRVVERKNRRRRGMGGIVVGVKKELKETGTKMVELGEGVVYVSQNRRRKLEGRRGIREG